MPCIYPNPELKNDPTCKIVEKSETVKSKYVKKSWGWELWFANVKEKDGPDYCGKILFIDHEEWSSNGRYHYHKIKDETFCVLEGVLGLVYFDEKENEPKEVHLKQYEQFRIKPGVKHKFTSITHLGCKFVETSTFHSDDDSYRCTYDVESGEWLEWPPSA